MASVTVTSKSYDGRRLRAVVTQTTNGSAANTSTINWTLYAEGGNTSYYSTGPTSLVINGVERYSAARTGWTTYRFPAAAGSVSGSFTVDHAADGSIGNIGVSLTTVVYYGSASTATTSGTLHMSSIARYFSSTPSISLVSVSETSAEFDWSTSETCSHFSISGGASSYSKDVDAKSGSFTLTGLTPGKKYTIKGTFTRKDSSLTSTSGSAVATTYKWPYIEEVVGNPLVIGNNPVLKIYNPLGHSLSFYMSPNSTSASGAFASKENTTDTTITLTPSATTLYNTIPNAKSKTVYYHCFRDDNRSTVTSSYEVSSSITPIFDISNFFVKDSNTAVTNITEQGENGYFLQNLSDFSVRLGAFAEGQNAATISKYEVTIGNYNKELAKNNIEQLAWSKLPLSGTHTITLKITDSRGLFSTYSKQVLFKNYSFPSIDIIADRENNYGTTVNLTTYYSFTSLEGKNGISVKWEGALKSGYLKGTASTYDQNPGTTASTVVLNVDNSNTFVFTATIRDRFGNEISNATEIPIGIPIAFMDTEQQGFGVNMFPKGQGIWTAESVNANEGFYEGEYRVPIIIYSTTQPTPIAGKTIIWIDTSS